nr:putative protein [uncultured bacterium]
MSPGHAEQAKSDIGNKKAAVSLNADASWLNKKIGTAQSDISMTPKAISPWRHRRARNVLQSGQHLTWQR